jgi:plasmid stabilization system protein ParE
MANYYFHPAALADYQQALAWYSGRSRQAARGFETAVDVALQKISASPETWPLLDDRHRFYTLRRYPYNIVFRIDAAGDVEIVAIVHAGRSPTFWQGRN